MKNMKHRHNKSYKYQKPCDKSMTFEECELAILRMAVDKAEEKIGKRIVNSEDVMKIIEILENFIRKKTLIAYGGTALNNILPREDQFYNKEAEIPDYDCFTTNGLNDAKELADIYYKNGFTDVEAKSGQHHGTYKVFVNYIPIADLTELPKDIFNALKKDAISVHGILYAPPNFLRMSMYLELSRPAGDTSRWEKVYKRLVLLNKHYPLTNIKCENVEFQREMVDKTNEEKIYDTVRDTLINQGVVFFGGYAISLYSKYMPKNLQIKVEKNADFDVLSNDPKTTAEIVKERLSDVGITNVKVVKKEPIGEIIPEHYEIRIKNKGDEDDMIAFIYKPIACHSYNIINIDGKEVRVATIDTMLSFYLAFLYTNNPFYNEFLERTLCMARFLFDVQQENRLQQKGLLKRFSITCYGHQKSIEEMRAEKAEKFKELKDKRGTREYNEWFLNYNPDKLQTQKDSMQSKSLSNLSSREKKYKTTKKRTIKNKNKTTRKKRIFKLWKGNNYLQKLKKYHK